MSYVYPSRSKLIGHQALPYWQTQTAHEFLFKRPHKRCWASLPHWFTVRRSQLWNLVSILSDFVPGQGSKLLKSTFALHDRARTWSLQHLFQQLVVSTWLSFLTTLSKAFKSFEVFHAHLIIREIKVACKVLIMLRVKQVDTVVDCCKLFRDVGWMHIESIATCREILRGHSIWYIAIRCCSTWMHSKWYTFYIIVHLSL